MKKKVLSLAIAAVMAPGFAAAADVSGFADIRYVIADDANKPLAGKHPSEGKFNANAEIDFSASPTDGVTVRVDADLNLGHSPVDTNNVLGAETSNGGNLTAAQDALGGTPGGAVLGPNAGPADSGIIEQAFFAWGVTEGVTVIGGVFNDPIGYEAEDAADMAFTTHGVVYDILDDQTALYGDNVAGLAVAGTVGPATITVGFLNDLQQTNEENSIAFLVNASPIKGLDLELGFVTQASQADTSGLSATTSSAEDVTDFNVAYSPEQVAGLTVGLDYLTAGKIVDAAYDFWVGYSFGDFGVKLRTSNVDITDEVTTALGVADYDATSIYLSYQAAKNLSAAIEFRTDGSDAPGAEDQDLTQLQLVAKF